MSGAPSSGSAIKKPSVAVLRVGSLSHPLTIPLNVKGATHIMREVRRGDVKGGDMKGGDMRGGEMSLALLIKEGFV
jgi:hypothetical protein